jgi:hypothetical protein
LERPLVDWFSAATDCIVLIGDFEGTGVDYAMMALAYEGDWAQRGFYLNDLHVTEAARRKGIGRTPPHAAPSDHKGISYPFSRIRRSVACTTAESNHVPA